jgi:hypothetical protein
VQSILILSWILLLQSHTSQILFKGVTLLLTLQLTRRTRGVPKLGREPMRTTTVRLDDEHEALMAVIVDRLQITSAEVLRKAFAAYVNIAAEADEEVRKVVDELKRRRMAQVEQETRDKLGEDALDDYKRTLADDFAIGRSRQQGDQARASEARTPVVDHAGD